MKKTLSILFIVTVTISLSCSQTPDKENKEKISGPKAVFEKLTHDFDTIVQNGPGTYEFVFKNIGDEPLLITNVKSSCGCTTPYWPKEAIKPGESSKIKVRYNTQRIGPFAKSVTVAFQNIQAPSILRIKGTVVPLVSND